jgi:hypothetical protein
MSFEVKIFYFAPSLDFIFAFKPKNSAFNVMWLKTSHYGSKLFEMRIRIENEDIIR